MKRIVMSICMAMVLLVSGCNMGNTTLMSEEEVKGIALKDAAVDASAATFLKVTLDSSDDKEYEIKFQANNFVFDYTIDARDGSIKEQEKETMPNTTAPTAPGSVDEEYTLKAVGEFGFTVDQVTNLVVEHDQNDGRSAIDVTFYKGNVKYSCEFDANTGLLNEKEMDID